MTSATQASEPRQYPVRRFEWERILRRLVVGTTERTITWDLKGFGLLLATYADLDGSHVRPGPLALAAATGLSARTMRRWMTALADQYGLLILVRRGGGRGKRGRVSEYRLALPVDLLDRFDLLTPEDTPDTPATPDGPSNHETPATQDGPSNSGDTDETEATQDGPSNPATPSPRMAAVSRLSPVDGGVDTPDTPSTVEAAVSPQGPANSGQITPLRNETPATAAETPATPGGHLPGPPDQATHDQACGSDPAQPQTARPRCDHGFALKSRPDGTPACALCRRTNPTPPPAATPPRSVVRPLPALAAATLLTASTALQAADRLIDIDPVTDAHAADEGDHQALCACSWSVRGSLVECDEAAIAHVAADHVAPHQRLTDRPGR